jgi:hypothetical protein
MLEEPIYFPAVLEKVCYAREDNAVQCVRSSHLSPWRMFFLGFVSFMRP